MLQPDTIQALNDSSKILPDSLAKIDSLARVDSLSIADSLKAIIPVPRGFVGIPHPSFPQNESWVFVVLFLLFFLLVYSISQSYGYLTETVKSFFQVKERSSIFSKATVNDFRFKFFLIIFSIGVLSLGAYLFTYTGREGQFSFKVFVYFFGVTSLFFVLKSFMIDLVGYVFLSPAILKMAKESYFNILSILGIVLYPILLLHIYIPGGYDRITEDSSLVVCLAACILVIIKLFQIFFHKIVASFYIMLYLCTLEFLPFIILFKVYQLIL